MVELADRPVGVILNVSDVQDPPGIHAQGNGSLRECDFNQKFSLQRLAELADILESGAHPVLL